VRSVVAPDRLMAEAYAMAHRFIDGRSAVAIAMTRQLLLRNSTLPHPAEAHKIDSLAMFYLSQKDGLEGVRAFREKRLAIFTSTVSRDMPAFSAEWLGASPAGEREVPASN
jgi:enoyl-CoA hydratase/carnithine racemase